MSIWSTILLFAIVLYSLVRWLRSAPAREHSAIYIFGILLLLALFTTYATPFLLEEGRLSEGIRLWSDGVALTGALCLLTNMVRRLKPSYSRYPQFFVYLPLMLLMVFPLIQDSLVLVDLMLMMGGGAGLVSLVLAVVTVFMKLNQRWWLLLGILLLMASFVLHWILGDFSRAHPWTVHTTLSLSIPLMILGYEEITQHMKP